MATAKKTAAKKTGPAPDKADNLDAHEQQIIEEMRIGDGYRKIAKKYGVSIGLLSDWTRTNPERLRACTRAREESADQCDEDAEEVLKNAKTPFQLAKAREVASHLRWRAKTRNPKRYGDKMALGGADDLPPIKTMTDEGLDAKIAALMAILNGAQGEPE